MSPEPAGRPSLALLARSLDDEPDAQRLAAELALPLATTGADPGACLEFDIVLIVQGPTLALQQTGRVAPGGRSRRDRGGRGSATGALPGPVSIDFGADGMRHRRRSGHNELLGKAVGVSARRRPRILDATAGLGRDSFVLADMGCEVILCEREPVIAAMLRQGLDAALASGDDWLLPSVRRMQLFAGDARTMSSPLSGAVEVIYLDPMFPSRDKSAAVKKEMALFQRLLDPDAAPGDAEALLHWALAQEVARIVVKRPVRASFLAEQKPSHSVAGKAVRFDVYVRRALG